MNMGMVENRSGIAPAGTGLYEYLLVAHPPAEVYAQVMAEKQFFHAQFKTPVAIKTKPHITVANFLAVEQLEETIIRWMHRGLSTRKSFQVTLNEFGAFRPHTIYLKIQDHGPFQALARELKAVDQFIQSYGCPKMKLVDNAHLTIARRLDAATYQEAVKLYSEKTFHAAFEVNELLLLRRRDQFDTCRLLNVFRLQPGDAA